MSGGPRQLVVQAGATAVCVADILSIARSAGDAILDVYKGDAEVGQWAVGLMGWGWIEWGGWAGVVGRLRPSSFVGYHA